MASEGTAVSSSSSAAAGTQHDSRTVEATLYYFGGRGRADQIRWMLAATNINFKQVVINTRDKFLALRDREKKLEFNQLPLLEIDGLRMTQSQAIVRYLARRANFNGMSTAEEVMCDMYAEAVNDMLGMLLKAPWTRMKKKKANEEEEERKEVVSADEMLFEKEETDEAKQHIDATRMKWHAVLGPKLEQRLQENIGKMRNVGSDVSSSHDGADASASQGPCLIGEDLTYADTLVAHLVTWLIEEIGCSCVEKYPNVLRLQQRVVKLPGMVAYLGSPLYYGVGDEAYVNEVTSTLGR